MAFYDLTVEKDPSSALWEIRIKAESTARP